MSSRAGWRSPGSLRRLLCLPQQTKTRRRCGQSSGTRSCGGPNTSWTSWTPSRPLQRRLMLRRLERVCSWEKESGTGRRRLHSSYYEPYPFDLQFCVVDGIYFSWDKMADKFGATSEKIRDYSVATIQGKPPASVAADLRAQETMPPPAQTAVKPTAAKSTAAKAKSGKGS